MGLRPAKCYRSLGQRPYTRIAKRVHRRNYIGTSPQIKTRQFNMGNGSRDFQNVLHLVVEKSMIVRDNALESSRIAVNRAIQKWAGKEAYFMKVRVYPFDILRENKQAQGAGADRVTKGMAHCFGKPIGRGVRMKKGQKIFSILVDDENIENAKKALLGANTKLPCRVSVVVGKDVNEIGTRPKKTRDVLEEERAAAEAKASEITAGSAEAGTGKAAGKGAAEKTATGKAAGGKGAAPAKEEKKGKK
ncbi:MAG: 50S ribosomal protein L16 [archaeon]